MSTPVGHILGSLAAFKLSTRATLKETPLPAGTWLLVAGGALLADADHVALVIAPQLEEYIHGPSHSILFCVLLATLAVIILRLLRVNAPRWRLGVIFFACAFMHPIQDYLMGVGPPVQFFWPVSSRGWLSPIALLPTSYYSHSASGYLSLLLYPPIIQAVAFETAAFIPLIMLAHERASTRRALLCLISFAVFLAVFISYRPFKAYWDEEGAALQKEMIEERVDSAKESPHTINDY